MIGNPNWFKRRKYSGWGITPKTWQGWVYVGGLIFLVLASLAVPSLMGIDKKYQLVISLSVLLMIIIDGIDIALKIKLDERELLHESIAERNVAWFITLILCGGVVYQTLSSTFHNALYVDPFIIIALVGAIIIKSLSFWHLSDK